MSFLEYQLHEYSDKTEKNKTNKKNQYYMLHVRKELLKYVNAQMEHMLLNSICKAPHT